MADMYAKAIRLEHPEEIPMHISIMPSTWLKYGSEMQRITDFYPQFFEGKKTDISDVVHGTYKAGTHTDEWGCVWSNIHEGLETYVTGHPVKSEEDVIALRIPGNRDGRLPHGFMYLRLLDLCGFELAMEMFAMEEEPIQTLIDKVLTYNKYQVEYAVDHLDKDEEIMYFGDDLGMQNGLAIGAERWRKYLKPCYKELYSIIKKKRPGTLVYMHTDGCIWEIMPDLVECGVDMINPQFRANGLDRIVEVCRKKQIIPINLDLDRQMFPFATPSELKTHVAECLESLYLPEGALGIHAEFADDVPIENIVAVLDALDKYRLYKG